MSSEGEDSIPSDKLREMEKAKIVVEKKKTKDVDEVVVRDDKNRFPVYYFISESLLLILTIVGFSITLLSPSLIFDLVSRYGDSFYWEIDTWIFIFILPVASLILLNTYLFVFKLNPNYRLYGFILRFVGIILVFVFSISLRHPNGYYYYYEGAALGMYFILIYAFFSQFILKIYLITNDKMIKDSLFRKAIAGSPSELEWRKHNTTSGYLAIVTGMFFIQFIWLFYHPFLRKFLMKRSKRKLIIESLDYEKDVNLTTVSLEIGLSLEECIFILKQMVLKREINVEFTRYGAILKEIRKPKRLTPRMKEKYDIYVSQHKLSEIEVKANRFLDLAEREKLLEEDFRKVLQI
ncbi:MAG: hypothetical protein H7641_14090, partial [Candidatus Heimdallarchaeota archaeon]|nr:hypothetical protein [Candidatus Heimdallarchaeota archaeon]MCK4878692.1 hypothetical protein [Candidatus Heimdallarchaeota archaeon]